MLPVPIHLGSVGLEALVPRVGDVSARGHSKGTTRPTVLAASGPFVHLMAIHQQAEKGTTLAKSSVLD